jgi:hypothetical protein
MRGGARRALFCFSTCVLLTGLFAPAMAQEASKPAAGSAAETSLAGQMFLKTVESSSEEALRKMPGLNSEVVTHILEHRKGGRHFTSLMDFRKVTKISAADLSIALDRFQQEEVAIESESQRKPVAPPPAKAGKAGRQVAKGTDPNAPSEAAPPAAPGTPQPGPVGAVRPGFYGRLPGYENLDTMDPVKKKEFLELVNREMCACGCTNETLAFCLVNDPGCPVVKARVRKIYEDVTGKPAN